MDFDEEDIGKQKSLIVTEFEFTVDDEYFVIKEIPDGDHSDEELLKDNKLMQSLKSNERAKENKPKFDLKAAFSN